MRSLTSTQSSLLCISSASSAGIGSGFFGCLLSYADKLKTESGDKHTGHSKLLEGVGMVGSTLFGLGSLVAINFGPVALVTVIRAGTLLPANAMFAQLFGLRPLIREDYLGTVVAISGVICFSIFLGVPGGDPTGSTYMHLITSCSSYVGNGVILALFATSLFWVLQGQCWVNFANRNRDMLALATATACIGGCSSAFMDVATKGWTAGLHTSGIHGALKSRLFWAAFLVNAVFLVVMRTSMIYGCKHVDVLLFVPLNTVLNILLSAGAGLVVLEEWRQVSSWPGLVSSGLCILGGVAMLVAGPTNGQDVGEEQAQCEPGSAASEESASASRDAATGDSGSEASSAACLDHRASMLIDTGSVLFDTALGGCHTKSMALSRLNRVHQRAAAARARWKAAARNSLQRREHPPRKK
eukprot:CAMPEP_0179024000 /NCGR_PEP_ID=MMETSP0796-20121207/7227_1 /TAXON_ID=73915 /ORGANISM="Pyrodinium bahamense, Strain pbaha01" /LENGTH=412 /DNA_ID=CAMNT_0020719943 /DNA_START=59 /DNA_END=1297 /DNA_ORIENTATION=-